jgi:hypothetical protein
MFSRRTVLDRYGVRCATGSAGASLRVLGGQVSDTELLALYDVLHSAVAPSGGGQQPGAHDDDEPVDDGPAAPITANVLCEFVQLAHDDLHALVMQAAPAAYARLAAWSVRRSVNRSG